MSPEAEPNILASHCWGDSNQPALVLLHGFLGSKDDWQPILPYLNGHFYCIVLDLPGHGGSEAIPLPTPGFEACAGLILNTLDCLGIDEFTLMGYSLGGRIALHLARQLDQRSPTRLQALLLESCHPGLQQDSERQARARNDALWAERLTRESLSSVLTDWYQQAVFADLSETQKQALVAKRCHANATALVNCYRATSLALQQDLWQLPNQLSCPVYFFAAERDAKFCALATRWSAQSPLINLTIKDAGHNIHIEQPRRLAHAIMEQLHMTQDAGKTTEVAGTINSVHLYRYRIPLQPTLPVGAARIDVREGLVLAIKCGNGQQALAEIAPLSGRDTLGTPLTGFSRETLDQVIAELQTKLATLPGQTTEALLQLAAQMPFPSAALGLSLAAAKLTGTLSEIRLPQRAIPLVYAPDVSAGISVMEQQIRARVSTLPADVLQVKVKIGQLPMEQEIALIHQILAANPKLKLRLDANRAFTLEQALDFCACLPLDAIEYIEEPCRDPADNLKLYQALGVHYALDESLNDPDYRFEPAAGLCALVLKPMLIGSLYRLSELIVTADAHGVSTVLSSALESSLGIADIRRLAAWLTPEQSPGIDTLSAFTEALIEPLTGKPCLQLQDLALIEECRL
ncbi:MAG: o-succinylbenzoate synthase [Shewanella sp.]|nr:o-succinylbenzoate synthase [Shewanella sp.]MCF1430245.1 o-succinylbenzoate synthase [Shewanella sp.]MCF1437959.1 o-succinylbenzoate synthase [Shewanella sp.]MCF1459593.1 o-succinylbenzoate synthase [Shewanella sp.]